jgi:hydrogenase maturation protease
MKTLILGVGNLLLRDEGVGIHVVRALEEESLPPGVDLLDGGTGGLHLLSWLEAYERIILIDATLDQHQPGTLRLIHPRYASDFPPLMSAHEIGLRDMVAAMHLSGRFPVVDLLLISVADIDGLGIGLSAAVAAALPSALRQIKEMIS